MWTAPTEVVVPVPAVEPVSNVVETVVAPVQEPTVVAVNTNNSLVQQHANIANEVVAPVTANPVVSEPVASVPSNSASSA